MSVGGQPIRGDKLAILLHRYSAEAASQNQLTSRIRVRSPNKFAQDGDILLWLQRFELYVARATIPRTEWAKEVLSLLEDGPFRVVSHLGLADSDDYEAVRKCLQQRYAPEGNELDWQLRLQSRTQKVGEPLEDYMSESCACWLKKHTQIGRLNNRRFWYVTNLFRGCLLPLPAVIDEGDA